MATRKTRSPKIDINNPRNESEFEISDVNNDIDMNENLLDPDKTTWAESDVYGDNEIPFVDEVYIPESSLPANKRRGVKPGSTRENIEIDYELQFNLDILQMLNKFDPNCDTPTTDELAELPGLGDNYIRRLRLRGLSLQSDLYKCLLIAEKLNVDLIGEIEPGKKFCDNALFIKVPKDSLKAKKSTTMDEMK